MRCPTILVATPGRLNDHLSDPAMAVAEQFSGLRALVYDEADRLLDQGFEREITSIINALPDPRLVPRQAMLFSATLSAEIREVRRAILATRSPASPSRPR